MKDGTYLIIQKCQDHDLAQSIYYTPAGDHIAKTMYIGNPHPKVINIKGSLKGYINLKNAINIIDIEALSSLLTYYLHFYLEKKIEYTLL